MHSAPARIGRRAIVLFALASAALPAMDRSASSRPRFHDVAAQSVKYIGLARSIVLTPAQQALRDRVLEKIPAACCAKFSAKTCCCPCNLAKTVWGLSNDLIVREGADAVTLDRTIRQWLAFVNPGGFSGRTCDEPGGCARKFSKNGCGGMSEADLSAAR